MNKNQRLVLLILRITIGLLFLYSGLDKAVNGFSSAGFLANATTGPVQGFYSGLAGNQLVDVLVVYGEILIGSAIITGTLFRFACYMGSLMMFLFYIAILPPEHGYISEHLIYICVLATLVAFGAGRHYGVDQYLEKTSFVQARKYFRYVLG